MCASLSIVFSLNPVRASEKRRKASPLMVRLFDAMIKVAVFHRPSGAGEENPESGDEIAEGNVLGPEKGKPWDARTGPAVEEFLRRHMGGMAMEPYVPPGEQLVLAVYVQNLEKSCRFFLDFGFAVSRRDGPFVELRWEDSLLFLVERPEAKPPERPVGNIRVMLSNVEAIYEKALHSGYPIVTPLGDRYYGLRDFVVAGPDGIHLRFASFRTVKEQG